MAYVTLKNYAKYMGIHSGDKIFISSDGRKLMWDAIMNKADSDLNQFIDGLVEAVGEEGTVIFPTYNWGFCEGRTFDYRTTPCMTGTLGTLALKRDDFVRTRHPIYSFAVYGKYQHKFFSMDNVDSFGLDSPFAFFKEHNVKNYIIDVSLEHCFTFVHFVEEQSGVVKYRYVKDFTAGYIDEQGEKSTRTYSMFVRKLDMGVNTTINPIEADFFKEKVERIVKINSSEIKEIFMGDAYDILLKDITENKSRKLCTFKGQ